MNYINDTVEGADDDLRFEFEYDTDGRQTLIRKPSGAEIEKVYNADGQLQYEFGPVNANDDNGPGLNRRMVTEYEYDTNGRIKAEWKGTAAADKTDVVRQQRVEYVYDQTWHAVAEKKFFAGATLERWEKYTYGEEYGDLVKVETFDGSGNKTRTVTYEHDGVTGQLVGTNAPEGRIEYGYDARGRLTRIRTSTGIDTKYTYDEYGRMKTIGDDGIGGEIKYSYDAFGRKNRIDRPNGTYTEYTYNNTLGAVESILHKASDDSTQLGLAYTRNDEGIITAIEETRDSDTFTWDYDYDGLDRLTSATLTRASDSLVQYGYGYTYDRNGNRLSKSVAINAGAATTTNYTYNALDQLTLTTEGTDSTEYVYDSIGRLITEKLNGNVNRNYTWSVDDHLLSASLPQEAGSPIINYSYDHEGRRVARWDDGVGKQYLQDNQNPTGYSQTLAESSGDGTEYLANYYYGDSFGPMAQAYNPESPEFDVKFLLGDHLSTTRGLTDAAGNYSGMAYSPFGDQIAGSSSLTDYMFTGQWKDATSGLQHHRARWLNTGTGRWASVDPVFDFPGNFGNRYLYVGALPAQKYDLTGKNGLIEYVIAVAVLATIALIWLENLITTGSIWQATKQTLFTIVIVAVVIALLVALAETAAVLAGIFAFIFLVLTVGTLAFGIQEAYFDQNEELMIVRILLLLLTLGLAGIGAKQQGPSISDAIKLKFTNVGNWLRTRFLGGNRPATQQPRGGNGVVLRDGAGATPQEIAASKGGPTGGSRTGQQAIREALRVSDQVPNRPVPTWRCWRCGKETTNFDNMHVGHRNASRSINGNEEPVNVVLEGAACNLSAGNRGAPLPGMSCAERGSCGAPYGRTD